MTLNFRVHFLLAAALFSSAGSVSAQTKIIGGHKPASATDYSTEVTSQSEYEYTVDQAPGAPEGQAGSPKPGNVPELYQVKSGDTLGGISKRFFGSMYEWPRIWSYNPQITNPNWIYPDTQVRLVSKEAMAERLPGASPSGMRLESLGRDSHKRSIYLRQHGFVDKDILARKGTVSGSTEGHMLLSQPDPVYVQFDKDVQAKRGQEWSIIHNVNLKERMPARDGILVKIHGTLRIDSYDAKNRMARATITESLDIIERGFSVVPALRSFEFIDPKPSTKAVRGKILAFSEPLEISAENQLVFINLGTKDGLERGNRLHVVRYGDEWRDNLTQPERTMGTTLDKDTEVPKAYPEETVAELRVVLVRTHTAACFITASTRHVEIGDNVRTRVGY